MRDDIILEDTTLRDGEQSPGVAFDPKTKIDIFDGLVDAGVKWVEAGIPAMGGDEVTSLSAMLDRAPDDVTLVAWNRGVAEDVKFSLSLGFKAIHIGLPTSNVHLEKSVRQGREWLMEQMKATVDIAKSAGAFVSVSAEDIGRTEIGFLEEYAGAVAEAGADRLRLSDTIGMLSPAKYGERVGRVAATAPIDTQCHTHNDFGLAVANTFAGLEAGARFFHVTVNGIGERAGMSDIAQVVLGLRHLYGCELGIDTVKLAELSRRVVEATKAAPPPWYPVVGSNVFAHESGIHANGMLRDPTTFEPFPPEEVAGERRYVLGKHSGTAAVAYHLAAQGVEPDDDKVTACLAEIRAVATAEGAEVSPERAADLYAALP